MPVALLDFLDLLLAEAEVVPDLVDQRLRNAVAHVVFGLAVFFDDALEQRDAVRQGVAIAPRPFRQRRSLIQAVEGVGRLDLHLLEQFLARLVLDHYGDVLHLAAEARRNEFNRFSDELFELLARHVLSRRRACNTRSPRGPNIDRRAALACRCAGHEGSARPRRASISPSAGGCTAALRL